MPKKFILELAEYFQDLPYEERKNRAADQNYIKHKEPELYEKFEQYYKDLKKKTKYCKECGVKFSAAEKFCNFCLTKKPEPKITEDRADTHLFALVREILHWEDMDIDFMYKRTMFLSDKLFKDVLFTQTDAGKISLPDINTVFDNLKKRAKTLLLQIYPKIENLLTHDINIEKISSSIIKGKINWNDTIINSIKQSGGTPITFTCMVPRRKFDTPENLLLLISINWLLNDAKLLLSFGNIQKYSAEQNQFLLNVQEIAKKILDTTPLREIREEAERKSKEHRNGKTIRDLIYKSNLRMSRNISKPHYRSLITWIRKYIGFNVNRYKSVLNFGYDRIEDVDKMFELWILFEIGSDFRTRGFQVNPITKAEMEEMFPTIKTKTWNKLHRYENENLYGFRIKNYDGISFDLVWDLPDYYHQQSVPGEHYQPDFLFRFDKNFVPLIMDAKNWHGNRPETKKTMIVYLAELDYLNPSYGMLLFSTYDRTNQASKATSEEEEKMIFDTMPKPALHPYEKIVVGSKFPEEYRKHWSITEANFVPSRKPEDESRRKEILDKIYEVLQQYIAPVPKITS